MYFLNFFIITPYPCPYMQEHSVTKPVPLSEHHDMLICCCVAIVETCYKITTFRNNYHYSVSKTNTCYYAIAIMYLHLFCQFFVNLSFFR